MDDERTNRIQQQEMGRSVFPPTIAQLQLDLTEVLDQIEHDLRGEFFFVGYDKEGNEVKGWRFAGTKMMNDEGVRMVMSVYHTYLTANTFLTVLDDQDIQRIMEQLHLALAALLCDKQEEFEIEDAYLDILMCKLTDPIWIALKRALNSITLNAMTETHRSHEIREVQRQKQGLGKLVPW